MERKFQFDQLHVSISPTREDMGVVGAALAAKIMVAELEKKDELNMIFASAPSQMDVINELMKHDEIDWSRINAFHMDEYIGLPGDAPQSFGQYLRERFFTKKPFKNVFYLDGNAKDISAECKRYGALLDQYPVDITFLGIGANGHLAFDDPGIADFHDPVNVKVNPGLDDECINQQVVDGWFKTHADVPRTALTLTIPALVRAKHLVTIVPHITKAHIIGRFFREGVSEELPGSIIRQHDDSYLFLDADSASEIDPKVMQ